MNEEGHQGDDVVDSTSVQDLASLIFRLQSAGLRSETPIERRVGGAGPTDIGLLWVEDMPVTVRVGETLSTPFVLRAEDQGFGIYEEGQRRATARAEVRPRYYDLKTKDGIPYWKIALLHLDSVASTVLQKCAYWGNDDQCTFCGIGVSLAAGSTLPVKRPEQLAEVVVAARDLDGAVDVTLTTGSTRGPDRGALYIGKCAEAVSKASGLPVGVQFEPPDDLDVIDRVRDMGASTVGIHLESFDPVVLEKIAPAKARTGIETYFKAWERGVKVFGTGQVSTYVILGLGEDPEITIEGCKRAVDIGVYPFIVPLRRVAGSLTENCTPPDPAYVESIVARVAPYVTSHAMSANLPKAGCSRCKACSPMAATEQRVVASQSDRPFSLPVLNNRGR